MPEEERQGLVNGVFATVAERYDLMNDLMSGGLHRLWKDDLIALLNPPRRHRPFACSTSPAAPATWPIRLRAGGGTAAAPPCCATSARR